MIRMVIASFYKFVSLPDCEVLQRGLSAFCRNQVVKGTILVAQEGVNGAIAGPRTDVEAVLDYLRADPRLADLEHRASRTDQVPFRRMKVRLRDEIITFGHTAVDPAVRVGQYVEPTMWNALISDPDTLLIDTRNSYEVKIGTFVRAIDPNISTFREFRDFVHDRFESSPNRAVALFCTGGIRCEKATSHMLALGFEKVYHLRGGILGYLTEVPPQESLWRGECFVFDERVAVGQGLTTGSYHICTACGQPVAKDHDGSGEARCPDCALDRVLPSLAHSGASRLMPRPS